jgi:hypothetical protein
VTSAAFWQIERTAGALMSVKREGAILNMTKYLGLH